MLQGNNIFLRRLGTEDSERVRAWRFSPSSYDFFYEFCPVTATQNREWIEATLRSRSEINFIIEQNNPEKDNLPIGMISLVDIDYRNRKCELGRVFVDSSCRGQGYAHAAISLLLEYAFNHLNMHKVYCEVLADNEAARGCYIKCGFARDGCFKGHIFKDGVYKDVEHFSVFRGDEAK